jgi:serine/threonine protein kinase
MAELLHPSEDTGSSGAKFVVKCGDITPETPNSSGWLESVSALQIIPKEKALHMSDKKILQGIINKRNLVVVKVANNTETLYKEWNAYQDLTSHNIPGILQYYCYFTCNDDITRFLTDPSSNTVCNGPGDSMQVLVMEYVKSQSMKSYNWKDYPIDVLKACVKQVLLTSLEAYLACGFIHGDLHLDNVLVKDTTQEIQKYERINIVIPMCGHRIKLMDLEDSEQLVPNDQPKHRQAFFKDVKKFTNKLYGAVDDYIHLNALQRINNLLRDWTEDIRNVPSDPMVIVTEILPLVDQIEFLPTPTRGGSKRTRQLNASPKRKRPPQFNKRCAYKP